MNEDLQDEIISINAIYGDDTLQSTSDSTVSLLIGSTEDNPIVIRLQIPPRYPHDPPVVEGILSVGDTLKGHGTRIVQAARGVLKSAFIPGSPCMAELVEGLGAYLDTMRTDHSALSNPQPTVDNTSATISAPTLPPHVKPAWVLSEVVDERKSIFVARAAPVTSVAQAKSYLSHLLSTDKRVAKATHNITAWRIRSADSSATFQDCDDDGETAAGGRLLHLLQLTDVWDVMIVVTRWYGGVHLGPARFKLINAVARDALIRGGMISG